MYRIFLCLLAVMLLIGCASARVADGVSKLPDRYYIENVPFTSQLPNFCGPASLSSLLAFAGVTTSQREIAARAHTNPRTGTNGADLLLYCRGLGLSAYSFNSDLPRLKRLISGGRPVLILQDKSRESSEGHFRVAVGYNDDTGEIRLRDSNTPEVVSLRYDEFDLLWKRRGRWAMLAVKGADGQLEAELGAGNAVLHMDLAQAWLHRGELENAEREARLALSLEPKNPYAEGILADIRSRLIAKGGA